MTDFEECFSFSAFTIVLMSMISLFMTGYEIVFHNYDFPLDLLHSCVYAIYALSHLLLIIVPASITNEATEAAKSVAMSLPYEISSNEKELKFESQKCFFQKKFLTLWNIYVLDRSLIFTAIGTLLTYGILLGTLGKKLSVRM
ncbi:hypothetical protein AVEN_48786-1 [Araneus ventricosus]|uniref:Uncharacterized protein n=1 Tax=Araneus ventricosus TaxID=182803 RepID=A0A4Y2LRC3_ARAVE|nr:hypothetical protein AVEN_48786-1 [Araneus ventricosus]